MPTYTYRCAEGHDTDRRVASYDAATSPCDCGLSAHRLPAYASVGINGIAIQPIATKMIPQTDAFTAIEEVQSEARKKGIDPPDLLAEGERRGRYIQRHDPQFVKGT